MTHAIRAEGLAKRFKETQALAGVDLEVPAGTVCGLLGPNGAGKTTAVRIFATLLRPDRGRAEVGGHDVVREAGRVRALIGLTGQYAAVDENLTGTENLLMIGRLLGMARGDARARAAELLDRFHLTDAAGRAAKAYSGACGDVSTWRPASSGGRRSSSSTNPPRGSIRTAEAKSGRCCGSWFRRA